MVKDPQPGEKRLPVLFLGHGSPMNAIEDNPFTQKLKTLSKNLPKPKAILVISAHWMTYGTWVTAMELPRTIHDFGGFPKALFEIQYPAPGSPSLAQKIREHLPHIQIDDSQWGLDHGAWSVLKFLFPKADVPVVQMSLDRTQGPLYHFELGQKLRFLRDQGVLIVGSGNIVHNLQRIDWNPPATTALWAREFDEWVKTKALQRDFQALIFDISKTEASRLSVPTPDHYYPLLYILGASYPEDRLTFDIEDFQNGTISMRSLRYY